LGIRDGREFGVKNFGDAHRVPFVAFLLQLLNASCWFSFLLSSWLPWIYSPFSISHGSCNGALLQLIECIESTRNEVKEKMIESNAHRVARKSPEGESAEKFARACDGLSVCALFLRTMICIFAHSGAPTEIKPR